MIRLALVFLFILLAHARGATITASSLSRDAVYTALTSAKAGDTVVLPAGSASWTSGISWNAPENVTVKGAGTGATGGEDKTVISDSITGGTQLWIIKVAASGVFRMTGITIQSGSSPGIKDGGTVNFEGPGMMRIDHCHFNASNRANYKIIRIGIGVFGVMDNCVLDLTGTNAIYLYNGRSGAGDTPWMQGNYEWSLPTGFGTADFFYVEDCVITGDMASHATRLWDLFTASRAVNRFNTLTSSTMGETHGTGHSGDDRGARAQEVYGNISIRPGAQAEPNYCMIEIQSGGGLIWGNSAAAFGKHGYVFNVTRKNNDTYGQPAPPNGWGYAGTQFNGTGSSWDGNVETVTGYPCIDMPGRGPGDVLTGVFPSKTNRICKGSATVLELISGTTMFR
jgi:hypothetical protein